VGYEDKFSFSKISMALRTTQPDAKSIRLIFLQNAEVRDENFFLKTEDLDGVPLFCGLSVSLPRAADYQKRISGL